MKKTLSFILAVVMVISMFAGLQISSSALSPSGSCGDNAFWSFDSLTGLLTISGSGAMADYDDGDSIFYNQIGIKTVVINSGVTSIGDYAFEDCSSLKSITIGNSVTSIGYYAFYGCSGLTSITIPDSVNYIDDGAFSGCSSLTSITVAEGNRVYDSRNNCNAIIETETNELISGCKNTVIPNSVTSIGEGAFEDCSSLKNITIGNSVTSIGEGAFYNCSALTSITIPDSVTSIGVYAFYNTGYYNDSANWNNDVLYIGNHLIKAKDSISGAYTIKSATKTIAIWAFSGCSGLTNITIPDSVTSIGYEAFYDTGYYNDSANWDNKVLYIGNHLIEAKETLSGAYTIKSGTKIIADYAFRFCSGLTSITIPDSVKSIGDYAFYGCSNLTSVTMGNSVTSIGEYAFEDCSNLTDVYYTGTQEQWNNLVIAAGNDCLTSATIHYNYVPLHVHDYTDVVTAPTCTEQGYTTHTCACGDSYKDTYVDPLGHKMQKTEAKAATCTEAGNKEYYYCNRCKKYFTDDKGNTETTLAEVTIDKLGHDFSVTTVHDPTCIEAGYTNHNCSRCDANYNDSVEPKLGHDWVKDDTVEPKCSTQGYTNYHCSRCTETKKDDYLPKLAHTPGKAVKENEVPATCTKAGSYDEVVYCSVCKAQISRKAKTIKAAHKWDNGKVTKKATPTATGIKTYTCKVCKAKKTEKIAKCAKYKNTLSVKGKKVTVKYSKLKKSYQILSRNSVLSVTKAKGTLSYSKVSGNKNIGISKSTGMIRVKKGLKKGTYKIVVKATAAGNATYKSATKKATITVVVK